MRTFIAIELDEDLRSRLADVQERLRGGTHVKWAGPEQMHLTVKFVGDIEEGRVEEVCGALAKACSESRPFEMALAGVGSFPPRGTPRIVWAGVEEPTAALDALQANVENALADVGFERETRRFHAHVTLGRVKDRRPQGLSQRIEAVSGSRFGVEEVRELVFIQSTLTPKGPVYAELFRCALTSGEAGH